MKTRQTPLGYEKRRGYFVNKGVAGRSKKYGLGRDRIAAESKAFCIDRIYRVPIDELLFDPAKPPMWHDATKAKVLNRRIEYCRQIAAYGRVIDLADDQNCPFIPELKRLKLVTENTMTKQSVAATKLHDAIEEYKQRMRADRAAADSGYTEKKCKFIDQAKTAMDSDGKHYLANASLSEISSKHWQRYLNYIRTRQMKSTKGTPISHSYASKLLDETRCFLDGCIKHHRHEMPFDRLDFNYDIAELAGDATRDGIIDSAFSLSELKQLYKAASQPLTKLMFALGLNTASGASELGWMRVSEFHFGIVHPHANAIYFDKVGDFFFGARSKTKHKSAAWLWPWVSQLVKEQVAICKANKWEFLFTDDDGIPLYQHEKIFQHLNLELVSEKPESRFNTRLRNAYEQTDLTERKSFNKIRKSFPNYLSNTAGKNIEDLALSHATGKQSGAYASRSWGLLFEATIGSENYWNLTKANKQRDSRP